LQGLATIGLIAMPVLLSLEGKEIGHVSASEIELDG